MCFALFGSLGFVPRFGNIRSMVLIAERKMPSRKPAFTLQELEKVVPVNSSDFAEKFFLSS